MTLGSSMAVLAGAKRVGDKNLSGTAGTPNASSDFDIDPATVDAGWFFNSDGSVQYRVNGVLTDWNPTPDEWYDPNGGPDMTYYIRATLDDGDAPDGGDTLNTIHSLASNRSWTWTRNTVGSDDGRLLIEIFDDGVGTTLLASGYYRGVLSIDPDV